ncbi:MAG: bZIP transcription factor [Alphaproteobacteria bacterium]|nr:MAG: bZIP transcription factor [Alphaproteobacteria bacterium]
MRTLILSVASAALGTLFWCTASTAQEPVSASPTSAALLDRLEALEDRSLRLEAENAQLRSEIATLRAALLRQSNAPSRTAAASDEPDPAAKEAVQEKVATVDRTNAGHRFFEQVGLGGQYRINGYVVDDDVGGLSRAAARLRLRQNLDFAFDERFSTHLQFELSHTSDNVTTTSESSRGTNVDLRHAVLAYRFGNGLTAEAGLLPLSDRFFDTQYSSDWDYNPLALALDIPLAAGRLRLIAADLNEGQETVADDFLHLAADYRLDVGDGWVNLGAQLLNVAAPNGRQQEHVMLGLSGSAPLRAGFELSGFVAGSFTDRDLLATARRGRGIALGLRLAGPGGWELLATHASGRRDGSGFLPVMALARTYGYWGLTGLLTVQGPTDTGFDGDGVNISNNGFGLTSVQGRYATELARDWRLTLAAGYFGNSRTPRPRSGFLGVDLLAMLSWRLTDILGLDAGIAYARLDDGVSGYSNGVIGGTHFNGPVGVERDKIAGFTRLQAEFP